ncbi:MAG: protein rep [Actinomycetaceae bacterium]|nr:protein rep [Actinomycetaceae bacterium]
MALHTSGTSGLVNTRFFNTFPQNIDSLFVSLYRKNVLKRTLRSFFPINFYDGSRQRYPRPAQCGDPIGKIVSVKVGNTGAFFQNVVRCGNKWICPTCSNHFKGQWRNYAVNATQNAMDQNMQVLLLTLTIPHKATDNLGSLLSILTKAWVDLSRLLKSGVLLRPYGYGGLIRATEVTYGKAHGWHPHFHVLLFLDNPIASSDLDTVKISLQKMWTKYLAIRGIILQAGRVKIDVRPIESPKEAGYIFKTQDSNTPDHYTPFELIDAIEGRLADIKPNHAKLLIIDFLLQTKHKHFADATKEIDKFATRPSKLKRKHGGGEEGENQVGAVSLFEIPTKRYRQLQKNTDMVCEVFILASNKKTLFHAEYIAKEKPLDNN